MRTRRDEAIHKPASEKRLEAVRKLHTGDLVVQSGAKARLHWLLTTFVPLSMVNLADDDVRQAVFALELYAAGAPPFRWPAGGVKIPRKFVKSRGPLAIIDWDSVLPPQRGRRFLRDLQADVRVLLHALSAGRSYKLAIDAQLSCRRDDENQLQLEHSASLGTKVLTATLGYLAEVGIGRLGRCFFIEGSTKCGRYFLANRLRQKYCHPGHATRSRYLRWKTRWKAGQGRGR